MLYLFCKKIFVCVNNFYFFLYLLRIRVRISVEGFSHGRPTDEIKSELINHFKSCGDLISVEVPTDPILERLVS